jgi:hypothetical protein
MAKKIFSQIFSGDHDSFIEHQINSIDQPDFFTTFYRRRISPNSQIEQNDRIRLEASKYPNLKNEPLVFPKLGIVIQGPVCVEGDFTSRVISRYLEIYPNALIIFSTWVGEEVKLKDIDELKLTSKFRIILNEKPPNPGFSNINLQIESTKNGLKLAKELNCEFAIKTRSDQAFLNVNSISLLHFELAQAENNYNKNERIVAVSLDTFLFRPYGVSDMFHFGRIETLLDFWEIDLDVRNPENSSALISTTLRDYSKLKLAECYLVVEYLLKKNFEPNFSLSQSLEFIRDFFVIVDQQAIDLVWNKNTRKEFRYRSDVFPSKFQEIQNWEWRAMHSSLDNFLELEFLLDYPNEF